MEEVAGHHELTDELLISVIDAAPDGMVVVDDEGTIEFANPMAAQLFGYPVDELVGRPVEILLPEPLRLGHVDYRETYTSHPRTRAMGSGLDLRGRRRSGEEFPIEIALSPVSSATSPNAEPSPTSSCARTSSLHSWTTANGSRVTCTTP